jgi:hypothetical protein
MFANQSVAPIIQSLPVKGGDLRESPGGLLGTIYTKNVLKVWLQNFLLGLQIP